MERLGKDEDSAKTLPAAWIVSRRTCSVGSLVTPDKSQRERLHTASFHDSKQSIVGAMALT